MYKCDCSPHILLSYISLSQYFSVSRERITFTRVDFTRELHAASTAHNEPVSGGQNELINPTENGARYASLVNYARNCIRDLMRRIVSPLTN